MKSDCRHRWRSWAGRLSGLLLFLAVGSLSAETWVLDQAEWSRPRSGETVIAMPPVAQAVRHWHEQDEARLELVYPGGERGELWASELRDWLIALGMEPAAVVLQPGAPSEEELLLRVRAN
ncbi:hypothetical protein VCB98_07525 [Gammaproteobacteria bacterium AB-CW1]|uniref:Uncharacterized protein n=1 Tax=Natronospira elongata TaxID=3110268 RepID=A0AAP6MK14_9GAMM|nr:hypothetical protein [Gammaproteobacteria bacterium AB-CW1]